MMRYRLESRYVNAGRSTRVHARAAGSMLAGRNRWRARAPMGAGIVILAALSSCVAPPSAMPGECGDGLLDSSAGEQCDDGNRRFGDGCGPDCRPEICGNGLVDAGEQCDDGQETLLCNADCTLSRCGDDNVNHMAGEQCDDGNHESGDGCSADCGFERCGNGVVDEGEGCDDGEESAACNIDCTPSRCGDGYANAGAGEECDDHNEESGDGCSDSCVQEACGNGRVDTGEECDDGNVVPGDGCSTVCVWEYCGNGRVDTGEECDDGNVDDSDWCMPTCQGATCDDGSRNGDELAVDCGGHCGDASCWQVKRLAAGAEHTCALAEDGAVRCWGNGEYGRLGQGNTRVIGDDEPALEGEDVDVGGRVVSLVAGGHHTCALMETGAVRCWGYSGHGELGYGNTEAIGDNEDVREAGDVDVGGRVVSLAAGLYHTCALMETGAVRCWGYNAYGQLGYGYTSNVGSSNEPKDAGDVDVGGRVVEVEAGGLHTCVRLESGAVRCWGRNNYGQLGYGDTDNRGDNELAREAGDVNVGGTVLELTAGWNHTCARLEGGAVRCWGYNASGQLGYGDTITRGDDEFPATGGDVDVGGLVVELTAGEAHTCARLEGGTVRCWGSGGSGRLGYGDVVTRGNDEYPWEAGDVDVGGPVLELDAGQAHTCARLESGRVRCWGEGSHGRLGYGNVNDIGDNELPSSAGDVPYVR
jgi:cysteine-rich repeat protein